MQQQLGFVKVKSPKSLVAELRIQCIRHNTPFPKLIQPAIDIFNSELVKIYNETKLAEEKQIEESKMITDNPLQVTGVKAENEVTTMTQEHDVEPLQVTGKEAEVITTKENHIDSF